MISGDEARIFQLGGGGGVGAPGGSVFSWGAQVFICPFVSFTLSMYCEGTGNFVGGGGGTWARALPYLPVATPPGNDILVFSITDISLYTCQNNIIYLYVNTPIMSSFFFSSRKPYKKM